MRAENPKLAGGILCILEPQEKCRSFLKKYIKVYTKDDIERCVRDK
jgi:hypothetical protein